MSEAIFRENANTPVRKASRFADVEAVDVGAAVGFLAFSGGLAMVWLPLAFIIPGGMVLAVCLWRILRKPRSVE